MIEDLRQIISSSAHIVGMLSVWGIVYFSSRNKIITCLLNVFLCALFLTMFIVTNNKIVMFFICVFGLSMVYSINKNASKNMQNNADRVKQEKRNSM
jgi:hypothetical protein